jgi:TrmH family RNA methyltransferase
MKNITVILVEPEHPGNVGAICRVMKNFDFDNLILLGPTFDIDSDDLRNRAKWANDLVDKIKVVKKYDSKSLKKLKLDYLVATTARLGRDYNILRTPLTPQDLTHQIASNKKSKIGIVFGREGSGLNNEEVKQCDFTVTIPTSKKYGTMNVSHAVGVVLYELFKANASETVLSHIAPMTSIEKKQLTKMIEGVLDKMHFNTNGKKETQRMLWKKLIGKSFLSRREAYALMGFLKKVK